MTAHGQVARSHPGASVRIPIIAGLIVGAVQAVSPFAFYWLEQATIHAIYISLIASIYVGFAVADGRPRIIAIESAVAVGFVLVAIAGVTGTAWLLVAGYAGHGAKDYLQERHHFVANTRWWPPFCAAIDFLVAIILALEIAAGVSFH
jgi:hypothetical protein